MWSMIVCNGDEAEWEQLMGLFRQCLEEKEVEVQITGCVPFFCQKRVTCKKMEQALAQFMEIHLWAGNV